MNKPIDFNAIDVETATPKRTSICEIGLCIVQSAKIIETHSWLVQPPNNRYGYWTMKCLGIPPTDTLNATTFPTVWEEIESNSIKQCGFHRNCVESTAQLYHLPLLSLDWKCSMPTAFVHILGFPKDDIIAQEMTPKCALDFI